MWLDSACSPKPVLPISAQTVGTHGTAHPQGLGSPKLPSSGPASLLPDDLCRWQV